MKALFLNKTGGAKKKGGATSDRLYLDYAAAAPILPSVIEAVTDVLRDGIANPSSIHEDGVQAKAIMERARKEIAEEFEAHADEIIFTGSGTESDNLAILGSVTAALAGGAFPNGAHVITTVIEHHAVLAACDALEKRGVAVTRLPVAQDGLLDVKTLRDALRPETVLVTVGYANSEVGTVQPVREIAKAIRHFKKQTGHHDARYPLFHTDACQAAPYLSLRVPELGVDLLTVNGAKLGGPCGIGMLYARRGTSLSPVTAVNLAAHAVQLIGVAQILFWCWQLAQYRCNCR